MADRQLYEFTADGFLFGRHWKAGEIELFYPKQVEGQGHRMKPAKAKPAPKASKKPAPSDEG